MTALTDSTGLGDRMKRYEASTRFRLPRRTYTVIRVDGRAFHTLLRDADKPFDYPFMRMMEHTARELCAEIPGAVFAYAQSDEISVLVHDFSSIHAEPWFGGNVQKISSVSASVATIHFARAVLPGTSWGHRAATFDGRAFTIPDPVEIGNYFIWRQRDAARNSVMMAAQARFSHAELQGLNSGQLQEKLYAEAGINWNNYPAQARRGSLTVSQEYRVSHDDPPVAPHMAGDCLHPRTCVRHRWSTQAAPAFAIEPGNVLATLVPPLPVMPAPAAEES